jgi:hypothetical protein
MIPVHGTIFRVRSDGGRELPVAVANSPSRLERSCNVQWFLVRRPTMPPAENC